jgi:hypothetical protein
MRLIKNLHFIQDFSRVRVCAAAAPPPSDRTNSERRPFAPRVCANLKSHAVRLWAREISNAVAVRHVSSVHVICTTSGWRSRSQYYPDIDENQLRWCCIDRPTTRGQFPSTAIGNYSVRLCEYFTVHEIHGRAVDANAAQFTVADQRTSTAVG